MDKQAFQFAVVILLACFRLFELNSLGKRAEGDAAARARGAGDY